MENRDCHQPKPTSCSSIWFFRTRDMNEETRDQNWDLVKIDLRQSLNKVHFHGYSYLCYQPDYSDTVSGIYAISPTIVTRSVVFMLLARR